MTRYFTVILRNSVLSILYLCIGPTSLRAADVAASASTAASIPLGVPALTDHRTPDPPLVEYGEFLFGSALLSADSSVSCGSCHVARQGYADSHKLAVGINGAVGRRRAPSIFNLADAKALMLDGRAAGLADQVHMPLEAPDEMAIDWPVSLGRLENLPESRRMLAVRPGQAVDRDLVIAALAAYVGTLVAGDSPFDRYLFGSDQSAIGEDAKEGFRLFVRKGRCSGCHQVTGTAASLTDNNFHSTGIGFADGRYVDDGRFEVTHDLADKGAFQTPTLRNAALRPYFMHDGSLTSLRQVLDYYNRGGNRGAPNLDGRIQPLFLTEGEIKDMLAFLDTLNSRIVSYRPWLAQTAGRP
jgi:cytochrome c peroxidase